MATTKAAKATTKKPQEAKSKPAKGTKPAAKPDAPKTAKTKAKETATEKPIGIIGSLVEWLSAASAAKPLTKADLLERLTKRFSDRSSDAMKKTIDCQIPGRLRKEKNVEVCKNENGYWIKK